MRILFALLVACLAAPAAAHDCLRSYHVDPARGRDQGGDGSAERPWRTITYALEAVWDGGCLWLGPGTYDAASGESYPLWLPPHVSLRASEPGRAVLVTGGRDGLEMMPLEGRGCAAIDGLVVVGAAPGHRPAGVGVRLTGCLDDVISHTEIRGFATGVERDLRWFSASRQPAEVSARLEGSTLTGNDVAIDWRVSTQHDEDWVWLDARSSITGNLIARNGAGLVLRFGAATRDALFVSTSIAGNTIADNRDAGVRIVATGPIGGAAQLRNNIVAGNGGGGVTWSGPRPRVVANAVWANAGDDDLAALADDNLLVDPGLVDPDGFDYRLRPGSPCIDAGLELDELRVDLNLEVRPFDGDGDGVPRSDIGAFESTATTAATIRRTDAATGSPMTAMAPPATAIIQRLAPGERDPEAGILSDRSRPLVLYQADGDDGVLLLVKDRAADSVRLTVSVEARH